MFVQTKYKGKLLLKLLSSSGGDEIVGADPCGWILHQGIVEQHHAVETGSPSFPLNKTTYSMLFEVYQIEIADSKWSMEELTLCMSAADNQMKWM